MRQKIKSMISRIKKFVVSIGKALKNILLIIRDILKIEWPKIKMVFGRIYEWISVFSTLTIFGGLAIFIYGRFAKNNQSDNDLIMQQIIDEVAGEEIIAINVEDIHGFGNNSIIVSTCNRGRDYYDESPSNNLLILDLTENEILHSMEDLLGTKSSYKTTFVYKLSSDNIDFRPITEYVLDVIGDSTKEIFVKYHVDGSTYGANGTAIFAYSYSDSEYKLIGTYPNSDKKETVEYDDSGNFVARVPQRIITKFKSDIYQEWGDVIRCGDGENYFNLNHGSWDKREYWVKTSTYGNVLAIVNIDSYEDTAPFINVYDVYYDTKNEELIWSLLYSEYIDEFPQNYLQDDLQVALVNMMKCQVTLIEKCNDRWY